MTTNKYLQNFQVHPECLVFHKHPLFAPYLSNCVAHVLVNCVGHLRSLHTTTKLHVQDTRVVSQPPVISFVTSQPCAVDSRLLTCTNTNNLSKKIQQINKFHLDVGLAQALNHI